jgi:hypothetical protein
MGASGADALPWSWKECSLLRVYEAYEFCLTLRAPRSEKSAERPPEGGFEGIEKVFAAVGLGGAAQPQPARRRMLSRDLFESPSGAPSRRNSAPNGNGHEQEVIAPPPEEALDHEKTTPEGDKDAPLKNLPYPFPGFGPRDSSEQEQIPFPPSPAVPDEGAGGHEDEEEEEEEVEGDIVVEVEDEGEEEEEEFNPRSSEEPSSFSGRASNSLSSLGQPITSRYPFAFRHPARGGSMSSTGSPPFAFSRATATPQSKSTSTRESHETRSTGNAETTPSSSPSGGSPVSAVSPGSSVPSPQDPRGMPMPPRHPAAGRHRPATAPNPVSPTPEGGLTATRPRQTFEGHRRELRHERSIGSELLPESDRESDRASRSGQPSPDGSLEAREREDSVGLLSAPSSQPSPRASLLGSRNGSATSLARLSGAFRPRSRSRNTSSGSGSGSASSRHNSHVSVSSASLALGRARTHSFIQGIGSASRSSIDLVLGRVTAAQQPGSPLAAGAVRLSDTSDVDGSEGALSNPESHTIGLPVVGGAGSLLPRRAGARARTLESDARRSVSVSSSSSAAAAAAAVAAAISARARSARGQEAVAQGSSSRVRSSTSLSFERERQGTTQLQTARSFGSQSQSQQQQLASTSTTPPSPSIMTQSMRSDDTTTTSGSTTTRTLTLAQYVSEAPSEAQTRAHTPAGVPIPSSPPESPLPRVALPPPPQTSLPGDLSTAPTSFVTAPPTIVSRTTDSGGLGRTPEHGDEGVEHYAPPHTRGFVPH